MTTERQPDAPARGDSFWTSATGIVSALAALITALVGAAALFYTVRSGQPAEQTAKDPAGGLVGASTSSAGALRPAVRNGRRPGARRSMTTTLSLATTRSTWTAARHPFPTPSASGRTYIPLVPLWRP